MQSVLVTGGAGYIGSHTCVELIKAGYRPVIFDNFYNSSPEVISRLREITGANDIPYYTGDIRDVSALDTVFKAHDISAVIHFAGLKAVGESSEIPLEYYSVNVMGTHTLLSSMKKAGVKRIVFSSSATVYGEPEFLPYTESHPRRAINTYGQTKLNAEHMLLDVARSGEVPDVAILRYFNPVGAHESGRIGEAPNGIPNNLMPFVAQVAVGRRDELSVFGDDYDTHDGTGVRDYIHVKDLARAHLKAMEKLETTPGAFAVNLGTGKGTSVLDMVRAFEAASGKKIPYTVKPRREGDLPAYWADTKFAKEFLDWEAELDINDMCRDQWNWQSKNPDGY